MKHSVKNIINENDGFENDVLDEKLRNIRLEEFELVRDRGYLNIVFKDENLNHYYDKLCSYKNKIQTYQNSCFIDFNFLYNELVEIKLNKNIVDKKLGFGKKVYEKIINEYGFIVGNRLSMSPYSKKLWERLKDSKFFYYIELTKHHFLIDKNIFNDKNILEKLEKTFELFLKYNYGEKNILNIKIPKIFKKFFRDKFKENGFIYGFNDLEKMNSILNKVMINSKYDISKYEGFMIKNNRLINLFTLIKLIVYNPKLFDKFDFILKYRLNINDMFQIALERPELKNKIDFYIKKNKMYFDS